MVFQVLGEEPSVGVPRDDVLVPPRRRLARVAMRVVEVRAFHLREESIRRRRRLSVFVIVCLCQSNFIALVLSRRLAHKVEAKELLRKVLPLSRRVQGDDDLQTLKMQLTYGDCLATALDATPEDFLEAEKLLDTVERRYRRIFGENHPFTTQCQDRLRRARVMAHNARVMAEQFG